MKEQLTLGSKNIRSTFGNKMFQQNAGTAIEFRLRFLLVFS